VFVGEEANQRLDAVSVLRSIRERAQLDETIIQGEGEQRFGELAQERFQETGTIQGCSRLQGCAWTHKQECVSSERGSVRLARARCCGVLVW
jgi:hypothetical protein